MTKHPLPAHHACLGCRDLKKRASFKIKAVDFGTLNHQMADHWKSTPTYWCKYCATYVRDTKLERTNHEATGKHQGAVKRFLRGLHQNHEREEREKKAAKREIARITGNWDEFNASESSSSKAADGARHDQPANAQQLSRQREQLAELGVAVPDGFRPEMAIPGEWTVTATKIIGEKREETHGDDEEKKPDGEQLASAIRKRAPSEDKEEEKAVQNLFKKPRRWGRDSRAMPSEEDNDLDALLSASTFRPVGSETSGDLVKKEEGEDLESKTDIKREDGASDEPSVDVKKETLEQEPSIKPEPDAGESGITPIVFKKRKPKGIRQK
ncbi:hypothetical protein BGZ63DRAFT_404928 [Mariannaea sp. PMI_226]|nr:hypothetical protein BGZ63DRAFT_404928 [Mariannaea sp. PMI_226]